MDKLWSVILNPVVTRIASAELRKLMTAAGAVLLARYGVGVLGADFEQRWADISGEVIGLGLLLLSTYLTARRAKQTEVTKK